MEGVTYVSPRRDKIDAGRQSHDTTFPHSQCSKGKVYKMTLSELRMELSIRGMKTKGDRFSLTNRLMRALDETDEIQHGAPQDLPMIDPEQMYLLRTKGHTTINSGGLGVGMALYNPKTNEELWLGRLYMAGDRTVFEAEYSAVILGMEYARHKLGIRRLRVQTSCDVIVQQIRGVYKVNKQSLRMLLEREQELEQEFDVFIIEDVSPAQNAVCKDLASKALATRKSVNVELDTQGIPDLVDPIQNLNRIATEDGRWKNPDPPSFSADIDPSRPYLLRFDGGSRGNPGIAGAGMVIYDDSGHEIWAGWKFHNEAATNNLAEYLGLLCGLKCARSLGIERLIVEGDSQLIVRQLTGKYQCREESLKKFFHASKEVAKDFKYFEIRHIPRAENKRADWLANHAMDVSFGTFYWSSPYCE
jgi:ribonuclease HI